MYKSYKLFIESIYLAVFEQFIIRCINKSQYLVRLSL